MLHPLTSAWYAAGLNLQPRVEGPHAPHLAWLGEAAWQSTVEDLASLGGWRLHHETDSRRTKGGWPDVVLVRGDRLVVLELKAARGAVSPQQRAWLADLVRTGVEVAVAGPGDVGVVTATLARHGPRLPTFAAGPGPVLSPAESVAVDRQGAATARARRRVRRAAHA